MKKPRTNYQNLSRKGLHTQIERMLRAGSNAVQIARALCVDEKFVLAVKDATQRRKTL